MKGDVQLVTGDTAYLGTGASKPEDDLFREAYCVLGLPIDVIEMSSVVNRIKAAAAGKSRLFISAPNLNTLVTMQSDPGFKASLLLSDLCPVDGMPIVWIARLIGVPIQSRIAGSDMFDALRECDLTKPLKVFLFGGPEGVASEASQALNTEPCGLRSVGSLYPGFGSVDDMSGNEVIDKINSSGADFLVVSLGAKKGQAWLQRNHYRLLIPIRAHLGAVINFQAAKVKRAPRVMRKSGLEWLWRIKEEPYLWRRYWDDGRVLISLVFTRVLPLAFWYAWLRMRYDRQELIVVSVQRHDSITLALSGPATSRHIDKIIRAFKDAIMTGKQVIVDFSSTRSVDARFLGLVLMLRKCLANDGASPTFIGLSPGLKNLFDLNGIETNKGYPNAQA
jgi:N-acetylglucosaminyldiphosphoundecaprenol N-acetyl-beta-D-mannosaminyltransferase